MVVPELNVEKYASKIEAFLRASKNSYSEARLVEDLFGIPLQVEGYLPEPKDVEMLRDIKEALRRLLDGKKIFGAKLEDPATNEQVFHYSSVGWYATP